MRSCEVWNFGCGAVEFGAVEYVVVKCEVWSSSKDFGRLIQSVKCGL